MKKELSPGVIIAAILGLVAVIAVIIFMTVKSDPAAQAPNPAPRFDPAAKERETTAGRPAGGGGPGSMNGGPAAMNGGPNAPGKAP